MIYKILIFESTHRAMKAEKLLSEKKIHVEMIPTPKEYSPDCGLAIRIHPEKSDIKRVEELLAESGIIFTLVEKEYDEHI